MKIKKALITAAGYGTRFLPISKTVKKEMMPILNRPVLDFVVADCYEAGVEEIIFVTKERDSIIQSYYSENRSLEQHLAEMGKLEKYKHFLRFLDIQKKITFRFIEQTQYDGYGTAVPLKISRQHLEKEEAFLVLMGDDFIYNSDSNFKSEAASMIKTFAESDARGLMTCITQPEEELHRYGVAEVEEKAGQRYLRNLIEKPKPGTAPSNLVNISKYILTPDVFEILESQKVNPASGEFYITDTVMTLANNNNVVIHTPRGEYLDGGSVESWLKANLRVAKDDPQLKEALIKYIKEEFLK